MPLETDTESTPKIVSIVHVIAKLLPWAQMFMLLIGLSIVRACVRSFVGPTDRPILSSFVRSLGGWNEDGWKAKLQGRRKVWWINEIVCSIENMLLCAVFCILSRILPLSKPVGDRPRNP